MVLADPAVESLSSFIGIDGTNPTMNTGRMQINLKPLDDRGISASDVIRRLQPKVAAGAGHRSVHAAGAGSDGGRSRVPHAVSVQPGSRRPERAARMGAANWSRSCRQCRSCAMSPAISRPADYRRNW